MSLERPRCLGSAEQGERAGVDARDGDWISTAIGPSIGSHGRPATRGLKRIDGDHVAACLVEDVERLAIGGGCQIARRGHVVDQINPLWLLPYRRRHGGRKIWPAHGHQQREHADHCRRTTGLPGMHSHGVHSTAGRAWAASQAAILSTCCSERAMSSRPSSRHLCRKGSTEKTREKPASSATVHARRSTCRR